MKKAIITASFGTSYPETRKKTIEAVENKIRDFFPEFDVFRAFTSRKVIKKIKEQEGIDIPDVLQLMERLKEAGYEEVYVQPLHIIPGIEYIKALHQAVFYMKDFKKVRVGKPLLNSFEDYQSVLQWIDDLAKDLNPQEAILFMGHGSRHSAFSAYACLDHMLMEKPVFICGAESYPDLDTAIKRMKKENIRKVQLHPFMLVAGDHATNDMASDDEDSWKSRLKAQGFFAEAHLKGMGEYPEIQDLFVAHTRALLEAGESDG